MSDPATTEVVDAAMHPGPVRADDLREYMPEPWRSRAYPPPPRYLYPTPTGIPPFGEYRIDAAARGADPGSDPELARRFMSTYGIDRAILVPFTRGLLPDVDKGTAVCAATNDWLAATWLSKWNTEGRFYGSIRVNPSDPDAAAAEIERWVGHPRMVQVAVPLESHHPYGQRMFFKIWEAAARHRLPVAVHRDSGASADFYPTRNGYPQWYIEYDALYGLNFIYHLSSLIAEGVLQRLPDLRFVFGDGGQDVVLPLLWRMDMDWPYSRPEIPWVTRRPSDYLLEQVSFATSKLEGPEDPEMVSAWSAISSAERLLVYASHFPKWSSMAPSDLDAVFPPDARRRILRENAAALYKLDRAS